jgi:SNF2 family DNA or RNA helicase
LSKTASMTSASWIVEGSRIFLKKASGELVLPPALDIFRAVFGRLRVCAGQPVRSPVEDIAGLAFSREPAQPAVFLSGTNGRNLRLSFGLATDTGFVEADGNADQLVHGGRWYPIKADLVREARSWLTAANVRTEGHITIGELVTLRAQKEKPFAVFDEVVFNASTLASEQTLIPGFSGTLYPYQSSGVAFLSVVAEQGVGCILGDEMGLGKTAQIIAVLQIEKNAGRGPSLVIAPATLLENWRRELALFAPMLSVLLHAGADRVGVASKLRGADIVLVSYDTTIRDEEILNQIQWNVIALDEAQAIKNPQAERTVTVKRLPRRVSFAISGTPLENRIDDLWSLADFVMPTLLGERNTFLSHFSNELDDAARLAPIVAPMLLRRKVLDVAQDLPERIEVPQALQMTLPLAHAYEALRKETLDQYGAAGGLVAATRLRMLCAHPLLVGDWHADPSADVPKYQRTIELLDEIFAADEKALIFSTYQDIADIFMSDIPKRFPKGFFNFIDGRVDGPVRQKVVDQFFEHAGYGALFLNPKAAGSGLNITAANHVIHYNPEWNPALTAQATARAYRRKQAKPVTIHHLFYIQTIEELIRGAAAFKRGLADSAVTGHDGNIDPVTIAQALKISPLPELE